VQVTLLLNKSGVYSLFLFDRWTLGNEVSLNETLHVTVLTPFCNVTLVGSIVSPILGDPATAQFQFLNGTNGWAAMGMTDVTVNGTEPMYASYDSGTNIMTIFWDTYYGGWRVGSNHVNITAVNGVYFNSTVYPFNIVAPAAVLALNSTSFATVYGGSTSIGFTFMNTTGGTPQPFPSGIDLYVNGSLTSPTVDFLNGSYVYVLDTHMFSQAGDYHLNLTANYWPYVGSASYVACNITEVFLSKVPMTLSLQTAQTSVTVGSSLSVSATLTYANRTLAPNGFPIQFNFIVTYTNGSTKTISERYFIDNGVASASLLATSDMKSISVNATYAGNGITAPASSSKQGIQVVAAPGLSLMIVVLIGGGSAALVVLLVGLLKVRTSRRRTEEQKTRTLVQTASLAQLLVVHLASGRCLFSRSIGSEEAADPNLISGFLSANQTLISEVFKKQINAGLKFADYGEYKVISDLGKHIMVTLFATESAGQELKDVLEGFTQKFEKKYGGVLESWDGDMNAFKDADALADEVFCLPLTAPYMLVEDSSASLSKGERMAVQSAKMLSAERGVFFMPRVIDYLLTKQGLKRGKAMDVISSLTKKGIFRQLSMEQAAEVIKSCAEKISTGQ
jgi:hypothetical protein